MCCDSLLPLVKFTMSNFVLTLFTMRDSRGIFNSLFLHLTLVCIPYSKMVENTLCLEFCVIIEERESKNSAVAVFRTVLIQLDSALHLVYQ